MDLPEEVVHQLTGIQSALDEVEEHLQPFLEAGPKDITAQLTPLERLKTHLALAQAAVVLYTVGRQLDAAKLDTHPVQKELERLAKYEAKVRDAVAADDLARTKPGASLNVDAANRFIDAAIPDLTQEQKAALRSRSKRPAAAAADNTSQCGSAAAAKRQARGDPGQQQQQRKGPLKAQEFLEAVVAEVDQQQQQQEQKQEQLQARGAARGVAGSGKAPQQQQQQQQGGVEVDADAFLQDIMASLDG